MQTSLLEQRGTRRTLLDIFNDCHGSSDDRTFTIPSLGLWATFLTKLGLDPRQFSSIRHRLVECSFLNVAFNGEEIILEELMNQQQFPKVAGVSCFMIPCVRQPDLPTLKELGYVCIPGFFDSLASFEDDWHEHFKSTLSPRLYQRFMNEINRLGDLYHTQWLTLNEFIADNKTFDKAMEIYLNNTKKFDYPAIHYSKEVLERISESYCSEYFLVALTYAKNTLAKIVVCAVDESMGYIAGLVHGIDYEQVQPKHNLYKQMYYDIYQYMDKNNLKIFDMGRGYVELKKKMGANRVEPLFIYLKPLNAEATEYVQTILERAHLAFGGGCGQK